jgi:hypothetical protein
MPAAGHSVASRLSGYRPQRKSIKLTSLWPLYLAQALDVALQVRLDGLVM